MHLGPSLWLLGMWGCAMSACATGAPQSSRTSPAPAATRAARVDVERLRRDLGGTATRDGVDVELVIGLTAVAVAQARGFDALIDADARPLYGTAPAHGEPVDVTAHVQASLELAPLSGLSWLVGAWRGTSGGVMTTELWCPALDGGLIGDSHTIAGGREVAFEWLAIAPTTNGATYLAQPGGRTPPTAFGTVIAAATSAATFTNAQHDFPQRLDYARTGSTLAVTATGSGKVLQWEWTRVGADAGIDTIAQARAAVPSLGEQCAKVRARANAATTR